MPAIRAACGEVPGPSPPPDRRAGGRPARRRGCRGARRRATARSRPAPRSSRRRVAATPSSEDGPSSTSTSPPRRCGASSVEGGDRPAALAGEVDRRDHPAQRRPARLAAGQERHPRLPALLGRQVAVPRHPARAYDGVRADARDRLGTGPPAPPPGRRRAPAGCRRDGRPGRTSPRRRCRRGRSGRACPSPARRRARPATCGCDAPYCRE